MALTERQLEVQAAYRKRKREARQRTNAPTLIQATSDNARTFPAAITLQEYHRRAATMTRPMTDSHFIAMKFNHGVRNDEIDRLSAVITVGVDEWMESQ